MYSYFLWLYCIVVCTLSKLWCCIWQWIISSFQKLIQCTIPHGMWFSNQLRQWHNKHCSGYLCMVWKTQIFKFISALPLPVQSTLVLILIIVWRIASWVVGISTTLKSVAPTEPSHFWIINMSIGKKFIWTLNKNTLLFLQENWFIDSICILVTNLYWFQCDSDISCARDRWYLITGN